MSDAADRGAMDPGRAQEVAERDQLWASLRRLRPQIEALASVEFNGPAWIKQTVSILARVVVAELDFRERAPE